MFGMVTLAFNIQPVKASGTIYIRADGTVDPPTAPIRRNGNFYALTGNIVTESHGIVIEQNNIVLDGEGYCMLGANMGNGIVLSAVSNCEIMNFEIQNFDVGIYFSEGSNFNRVSAVNIVNNSYGILLEKSYNNTIFANSIERNTYGVGFSESSNNRLYYVNFVENDQHVYDFASGNPIEPSINLWDDGYSWGGNYWSDYTGTDVNGDGIGDTPYIIDYNNVDYHPICSNKPLHPNYYETSEYMIGSIAVGVILPESNGAIDPNTENWTETEESKVIAKITNALNWLKAYNPSANISFSMEVNYRVPTGYEPISRWYGEYPLWVTETIDNLGYRSILDYANILRNRLKTDWAIILFIVDSSNDADGCFLEGYNAGAIIGGPFVISTIRMVDGNMDDILAHEICHLFYATDEYNMVEEFSGYLNCSDADSVYCLMTRNARRICQATQEQLGWRDTDEDGIPDIIDTFPKITLDMRNYQETDGTLIYSGFVTEDPYPNSNPYSRPRWPDWQEVFFRIPKTRKSITINTITKVEYRVDDGPWMSANPTDGNFDEAQEYFTLNISLSLLGNHSIDLRAMNSVGNVAFLYSNPWETSFVGSRGYPIVDMTVYRGTLYAAADNELYMYSEDGWSVIKAPTYVSSIATISNANHRPPPPEWNRTYGGTADDIAFSLVNTNDGGYAIAGWTNSFGAGNRDFLLVKTDAAGNMQWSQTYGGIGDEIAYDLIQTGDGGYLLVGYTDSFGAGDYDFWLVKTDAEGNMQWNQTYGGTDDDGAQHILQTSNGEYAVVGWTNSFGAGDYDFWLVKIDAIGIMLWNKTYGGIGDDEAFHLVLTQDGGYAIAGATNFFGAGDYDFWLVKTDADGNMQWNQTYGGANDDCAYALVQTDDGGYVIAGYATSFACGWDFWAVKVDADGNMQWNQTYGGNENDLLRDLVQTVDGGYAFAGITWSFGAGGQDFLLVRTDANGNIKWSQTYGGIGNERASALLQTSDGGYVIAGHTTSFGAGNYDVWLVKIRAFDPYPQTLVVGGQGGLYYYNGTSFILIFSVPSYIKVLGVYNNRLYAGTMLDNPPKLYYCSGSPENPANWHIDTDFSSILDFSGPFGTIDSFAEYNKNLYVTSGGTVYCYNGTEWSVIKTYDDVYAYLDIKVYNDKLYLATRDQAWRKPLYQGGTGFGGRVIQFDGSSWTTIFEHDYWIFSLETYDNKLFVGTANKIYTYNGANWNTSFNATQGAFYAICMIAHDNAIYAGMGNGYIIVDPAPLKTNTETATIPEFPSILLLPLFMAFSIIANVFAKKKRK
jgi:parallel beta-helix repeat protein